MIHNFNICQSSQIISNITQSNPNMPQSTPNMPQSTPNIPQNTPNVLQKYSIYSLKDSNIFQSTPILLLKLTKIIHNCNIWQSTTTISNIPQSTPKIPHSTPNTLQNTLKAIPPKYSQLQKMPKQSQHIQHAFNMPKYNLKHSVYSQHNIKYSQYVSKYNQ